MWVLGDWGQSQPWQRTSGVKMTKGEGGVYTGVLTLPKGTKFEIQVMKSTVSTTSGGENKWTASRYKSILNKPASHDFGEFTTNLIPNGNFDEGQVKWTPASQISQRNYAQSGDYVMATSNIKCTSDVFTVPANQSLQFTGYIYTWANSGTPIITVESVAPQQQTLLELKPAGSVGRWTQFSGSFRSDNTPTKCRITLTTTGTGSSQVAFDTLYLVSV